LPPEKQLRLLMARILITTSSFDIEHNDALRSLRAKGWQIDNNPHGRRLSETEAAQLLANDYAGVIAGVEPLTRKVLAGAHALKVISRCGIGMDSVDLEAAAEHGISVYNTPGAPVSAVAELTLALILGLLRRIGTADRNLRGGEWKQLMGNLLAFQTVGIIGFGRIGRRVAELLHAFGAKILVNDRLAMNVPAWCEMSDLDALLQRADVVSLHLPLLPDTHHMIGPTQLNRMKPGAFLVNAARGGLIDETALFEALQSGQLAGAALDTFEAEPYSGPLTTLPQVLLTAHMGSYARESRIQMEQEAAHNLLQGLTALGIVATAAGNSR
jgi:D-3-phosphoglycerate dehydrogenase